MDRITRLANANRLLETIASCGRHFFCHRGEVSRLELDQRGRIWFVDSSSNRPIYTHTTYHQWRGFTEGGTLRCLIIELREYIQGRRQVLSTRRLGPWPQWICEGDLWGYGEDMTTVRTVACELGLIREQERDVHAN